MAAATAVICAAPSFAGDILKPRGVVELFTSQGCNSCPPADAVLAELAQQGDVVTLGYHVDYWDYLGWKDTLGSPENTERQKLYGKAFGKREVYTPQAVINGRVHVKAGKREAVDGALTRLENRGEGLSVDIDITRAGDSVMIDAAAAPGGKGNAHLVLVHFDRMKPVTIERGENKGRTITYANPVTNVQTAGMWHGSAQRFELPRSEVNKKGGCAILLQSVDGDGLPGPIIGAAVVPPEALAP
ncbi:MAG: thioredoxin family protein [Pseudomonadota bacterium]|nr:thioredoxin family protein [Pseudomonadota bacterium]